jgi:hypothetical protein
MSNRLRASLALCVLAATPAATCGITLGALALRVQAIEESHWIVVDAEDREIGAAIDPHQVLVRVDGFKPLLLRTSIDGPAAPLVGNDNTLYFESVDCSGSPYLAALGGFAGAAFFHPDVGLVGEVEESTPAIRTLRSRFSPDTSCIQGSQTPGRSVEGALVEGFEAVPPLRLVTLADHPASAVQ